MKRPGGFDRGDELPEERDPRESRLAWPHFGRAEQSGSGSRSDSTELSRLADPAQPVEAFEHAEPAARVTPLPVSSTEDDAEQESTLVGQADEPRLANVRAARLRLREAERSRRAKRRVEQKRFTAHLRRRRRYLFAGLAAVFGLAIFVAVGVFTPLMSVKEVRIVGVEQVNVDELRAAVSQFEGVPIALVNDQELHRALEPFAQIERYALDRIPPHTLVLRIEEREGVIALERDGRFVLYDAAGVLIGDSTEQPEGVPLAEGPVREISSTAFDAAAQVIRSMPADVREKLSVVTAESPRAIVFVLHDGVEVIWGDAALTQHKSVVLRSMLSAVAGASTIDVSSPDTPVFR